MLSGWLDSAAGRTALLLSLALLPLAVVALLSTLQSLEAAERDKLAMLTTLTEQNARKLESDLVAAQTASRLTVNSMARGENAGNICGRMQAFLRGNSDSRDSEYAVFDRQGRLLCGVREHRRIGLAHAQGMRTGADVLLVPELSGILARTQSADGATIGVAYIGRDALFRITRSEGPPRYVVLEQDGKSLIVDDSLSLYSRQSVLRATLPVGQSSLRLTMGMREEPRTFLPAIAPFLPLLMWTAAAALGWIVVRLLLIQPILRLRRAVASYKLGEVVDPTELHAAPEEIVELAKAFHELSLRVARHDEEMHESLARQTRLTREVHHRVKNNLQIISSLISLHSRTAENEAARQCYASIQRRVDALAVVQRNHYAEMEVNRGVSAPPLISEVAASLRASAISPSGRYPVFQVDTDQVWLHQDVAAPVAFLIAELADLAMMTVPDPVVRISLLKDPEQQGRAILTVCSQQFTAASLKLSGRADLYDRVLNGLSRQLRTPLEHDDEKGAYRVFLSTLS